MALIDLSAPIEPSPQEVPEPLRVDVRYDDHAAGPPRSRRSSAFPRGCCATARAGRSRSSRASAPTAHPRRCALALQHHDPRRARADDRRAAAGVVLRRRRGARHDRPSADGEVVDAADVEAELGADRLRAPAAGHRPGADRPRRLLRAARLHGRGPGVSAEATRWLYERGVRVMGIDAWGWDARWTGRPPRRSSATRRGSSGRPTRSTSPTRRSSGSSTSASCRRPASRSPASRCASRRRRRPGARRRDRRLKRSLASARRQPGEVAEPRAVALLEPQPRGLGAALERTGRGEVRVAEQLADHQPAILAEGRARSRAGRRPDRGSRRAP